MLCHFLNRGIEPKKIINLPLSDKLFYKASYEIYMEDEYEKYKALTGVVCYKRLIYLYKSKREKERSCA